MQNNSEDTRKVNSWWPNLLSTKKYAKCSFLKGFKEAFNLKITCFIDSKPYYLFINFKIFKIKKQMMVPWI